jgi:hypothetical protein
MLKLSRSIVLLSAFCMLMVSCRNTSSTETVAAKPVCNTPQQIRAIYKEDVYDLSGYENSGGGGGFYLFDENPYSDPKYNIKDVPTTGPQPIRNADNYFKHGKGNRIVVDLRIPYKLSEIYLYDGSSVPDTVCGYIQATCRNGN